MRHFGGRFFNRFELTGCCLQANVNLATETALVRILIPSGYAASDAVVEEGQDGWARGIGQSLAMVRSFS